MLLNLGYSFIGKIRETFLVYINLNTGFSILVNISHNSRYILHIQLHSAYFFNMPELYLNRFDLILM